MGLQYKPAELRGMGQALSVDYQTEQNLTGTGGVTKKNMPNQPRVLLFLIHRNFQVFQNTADGGGNLVQELRLETAVLAGNDPMTVFAIESEDEQSAASCSLAFSSAS